VTWIRCSKSRWHPASLSKASPQGARVLLAARRRGKAIRIEVRSRPPAPSKLRSLLAQRPRQALRGAA
jgi:hypothetical protein